LQGSLLLDVGEASRRVDRRPRLQLLAYLGVEPVAHDDVGGGGDDHDRHGDRERAEHRQAAPEAHDSRSA
jgi:hypothetical protein